MRAAGVRGAQRTAVVLAAVWALAAAAAPIAAQEPRPRWEATVSYGRDAYEGSDAEWQTWTAWTAGVLRRFEWGALGVDGGLVSRFGVDDERVAVDVYRTLWDQAYAYVRADVAPDAAAIARSDLSAELFQGVGEGWEPSISYRRMGFADGTAHLGKLTIARIVAPWHARVGLTHVSRSSGGSGASLMALLRRSIGAGGGSADVAGSFGEEITMVAGAAAPVAELRETTSISATGRVPLGGLGIASLGIGWTALEGVPDRTSGSLGFTVRW